MMMLLAALALASAPEEPRECEIQRVGTTGTFAAYRLFDETSPSETVRQLWKGRRAGIALGVNWNAETVTPPPDAAEATISFFDVPKGVDVARIELWRDGKRVIERVGSLTNLKGLGYRYLYMPIPWGELRALASGGPLAVTVVDEDGDRVAARPLPAALVAEPVTLAEGAQEDFADMMANWRRRCPLHFDEEIVVT